MNIRQELHLHPGVSGNEFFAHDLVVRELATCRPDRVWDHVGGFGVVAVWGTHPSRPTVALRADIDALPIGHRCGHDGHTTILLQVAQMVAEAKESLTARINCLFVFQPEEETGTGARKILDSGILQQYNIKAVFGLHNLPGYPLGTVVLNPRTFAAASTGVIFRLEGRCTHASTPELGLNPGAAAAEIIQQIQHLNTGSRMSDDNFWQTTLICVRIGEETFGTAAGSAELMFTLRAFTNSAMKRLIAQAAGTAGAIASNHCLRFEYSLRDSFRATENNSYWVEYVEEHCGCRFRHNLIPFRWSEDFADYLLEFPGAFFGIGAGEQQPELHHPDYVFPDSLTQPAAQVFFRLINNIIAS